MKNLSAVYTTAVLLLCANFSLFAQSFTYPYVENFGSPNELYLAAPDPREGTQLLPGGIDLWDGDDVNTIYYGMVPAGSQSKPVLVFVHGYASSASIWYEGRDNMYHDTYQDGYRTAFVSLTPNRHMWTNGNMLSNSIDQIKAHYGVNDVVVVAHSKGGVDTDAAVVHYGANNKVSQVFTLSSPHNGTALAEVANSVLLSLVNIIFMQNNDATKSLRRGYMSYFRSLTDGQSTNTVDFTTFGAWGNGPLARLAIPQGILYAAGGSKSSGGNDGVVPYASSRRPGGRELFDGQRKEYGWFGIPYYPGPSETELDHFEVTRGDLVWPYVKGVIEGTLRTAPQTTPQDIRPNLKVASNMQIVASAGGADQFFIHEADENVSVWVAGQGQKLRLRNLDGGAIPQVVRMAEGTDEEGGQYYTVEALPGRYGVEMEGEFVALVTAEGGVEVNMESIMQENEQVFKAEDAIAFKVSLAGIENLSLEDLQVSGTVQRDLDLEMNNRTDAARVLEVRREGETFVAEAGDDLPGGIYSVTLTVKGEGFARTLVSSVAKVGEAKKQAETVGLQMEVFPNPFSERLTIRLPENGTGTVTIFNVFGQQVHQFAEAKGNSELIWNAKSEGASVGIYFVEWQEKGQKRTEKVVLR